MWSSPTTKSLDPIFFTALRVVFPLNGHAPATCGFACNCQEPEASGHNLPTSITIGNAQIPFKQPVKNLGFALDCHLTVNAHVTNIARTCYFELRRLASIRKFQTSTATATLVSALFCQELTTVAH